MKSKILILLLFTTPLTLKAQVSETDFFKAFRILKKNSKDKNLKFEGSFTASPLLSKSTSQKEILFKDKSIVYVTLMNGYDCEFRFDVESSQKVKSKSKKNIFNKNGLKITLLTFITSYYHKINFWSEVKNKCKNYDGHGLIMIHSEKVKL